MKSRKVFLLIMLIVPCVLIFLSSQRKGDTEKHREALGDAVVELQLEPGGKILKGHDSVYGPYIELPITNSEYVRILLENVLKARKHVVGGNIFKYMLDSNCDTISIILEQKVLPDKSIWYEVWM